MEQASSLDYLNEIYNGSTDRIHIRFLCNSMIAEEQLMKSLQRSWASLCDFFPNNEVDIDISNHPILNIYPYEKNNKVEIFQEWTPTVYFHDNFICGSPISGFKNEVNDPLIKKIYTEQFYFRLSVLCFGRERQDESKKIIHNLLQNSDIPNVIFSSIEIDSSPELGLFDMEGVVPNLTPNFTFEPFINTPKKTPVYVHLKDSGITGEHVPFDFWRQEGDRSQIVPVIINGSIAEVPSDEKFGSVSPFCLSTEINWHKTGSDVFVLSEHYQGKEFPIWEVVKLDSGYLSLSRKVSLPVSKTVEDALSTAQKYPTNGLFQEVFPFNYVLAFKFSDVPFIPSLLQSGVFFTGASMPNNIEGFSVFVDDSEGECEDGVEASLELAILKGTEPILSEFLKELINVSEKQGVVSLGDMRLISQTLNAEPIVDDVIRQLN